VLPVELGAICKIEEVKALPATALLLAVVVKPVVSTVPLAAT